MSNVINLTEIIGEINSEYKVMAMAHLERFDIEYVGYPDDKSKTKHYPLTYGLDTLDSNHVDYSSLKLISDACWFTLYRKLADAKQCKEPRHPGILLKEGETGIINKLKIGKVFITGPASFSYKNYIPSKVQVYAFQSKDYVRGEINFGIELYD